LAFRATRALGALRSATAKTKRYRRYPNQEVDDRFKRRPAAKDEIDDVKIGGANKHTETNKAPVKTANNDKDVGDKTPTTLFTVFTHHIC